MIASISFRSFDTAPSSYSVRHDCRRETRAKGASREPALQNGESVAVGELCARIPLILTDERTRDDPRLAALDALGRDASDDRDRWRDRRLLPGRRRLPEVPRSRSLVARESRRP